MEVLSKVKNSSGYMISNLMDKKYVKRFKYFLLSIKKYERHSTREIGSENLGMNNEGKTLRVGITDSI